MDNDVPAAYTREPYRVTIDTTVVADGMDARGRWVELADTVLYPEGGGQPSDRGWIDGRAVVDVQRVTGAIRHYLAADADRVEVHAVVRVDLDWPRRYDLMQQHTAQHVLTAVAADRFGWPTTAFHLGTDVADVELDVPALERDALDALESAVAAELRAALPVRAFHVPSTDVGAYAVRSRGLPHGHSGPVRLVSIGELDVATCGGTHVGSTAEVEALALLATERMRGGLRLTWVAGGRVRRRMAAHEARLAALRASLGAADDALVGALDTRLARLAEADRRVAVLGATIASLTAERLVAAVPPSASAPTAGDGSPSLVTAYLADASAADAAAVARAVTVLRPDVIAVLSAGRAPNGRAVIAADPALDAAPVAALAAAVFGALGGQGGGGRGLHQGVVATPERIASATASLEVALRQAWSGRR